MCSRRLLVCLFLMAGALLPAGSFLSAQDSAHRFQPMDVFGIEVAADPQISPDGRQIVYVRSGFDVMTDGGTSNLWIINADFVESPPPDHR